MIELSERKRKIKFNEFKRIRKGDSFLTRYKGGWKTEVALKNAYFNRDSDFPEWEVETVSGAYYNYGDCYQLANSTALINGKTECCGYVFEKPELANYCPVCGKIIKKRQRYGAIS